jgi:hypothetical protein
LLTGTLSAAVYGEQHGRGEGVEITPGTLVETGNGTVRGACLEINRTPIVLMVRTVAMVRARAGR